jgi:hypothetical protein
VTIAVLTWYVRARGSIRDEYDANQFWPRLAMFSYAVMILIASVYNGVLSVNFLAFLFWTCVGLETGAHSQQTLRQPIR